MRGRLSAHEMSEHQRHQVEEKPKPVQLADRLTPDHGRHYLDAKPSTFSRSTTPGRRSPISSMMRANTQNMLDPPSVPRARAFLPEAAPPSRQRQVGAGEGRGRDVNVRNLVASYVPDIPKDELATAKVGDVHVALVGLDVVGPDRLDACRLKAEPHEADPGEELRRSERSHPSETSAFVSERKSRAAPSERVAHAVGGV